MCRRVSQDAEFDGIRILSADIVWAVVHDSGHNEKRSLASLNCYNELKKIYFNT